MHSKPLCKADVDFSAIQQRPSGDEHLAVWHLPYEKKRGLYRLFRLLEKQKGLGDEARFWEKAKAWTGVPAVSLVKRLRDRWTTLRMRFD